NELTSLLAPAIKNFWSKGGLAIGDSLMKVACAVPETTTSKANVETVNRTHETPGRGRENMGGLLNKDGAIAQPSEGHAVARKQTFHRKNCPRGESATQPALCSYSTFSLFMDLGISSQTSCLFQSGVGISSTPVVSSPCVLLFPVLVPSTPS